MSLGRLQILDITDRALAPEAAFRAVAGMRRPFFLDSALRMAGMGRYSILGAEPFLVATSRGRRIVLEEGGSRGVVHGSPFAMLRDLFGRRALPSHPQIPFVGGAVGYLGYDLGRMIERLPCTTLDDIGLPELYMGFYDTVVVYDHEDGRVWAVGAAFDAPGGAKAEARVAAFVERLTAPVPAAEASPTGRVEVECNFSRSEYLRAVQRAKDYIAEGDIFQVNLSRRFETRTTLPPADLYLRLRRANPAPMAAYLAWDDFAVISASPERFLRVRAGHVETRPIKGTRPRGRTPQEDAALAEELVRSEKDNAELAMIVDLERNDLGRVCSYGSIRVTQPRVLESYPTVHHLVATVEGDLHPDHDMVDLLRATFPGGSITGAPKIRAMQIIDELEPTRRSLYTGAMGYLGFDGSMDTNIVIRTFLMRGDRVWFQAGGGIVADSELDQEYDETYHKARALIEAVAGR